MNKRVVNRIFKNVTKKSKKLLCKSESYDVDFKKTVKSISTEDLVAFSNSPKGGTILVGVEEIKDKKGNQKGKIVGCSTGDKDKLVILNIGKQGDGSSFANPQYYRRQRIHLLGRSLYLVSNKIK